MLVELLNYLRQIPKSDDCSIALLFVAASQGLDVYIVVSKFTTNTYTTFQNLEVCMLCSNIKGLSLLGQWLLLARPMFSDVMLNYKQKFRST